MRAISVLFPTSEPQNTFSIMLTKGPDLQSLYTQNYNGKSE